MQAIIDKKTDDMKKFYSFDRFDIDYLADAILFSKVESAAPATPTPTTPVMTSPAAPRGK